MRKYFQRLLMARRPTKTERRIIQGTAKRKERKKEKKGNDGFFCGLDLVDKKEHHIPSTTLFCFSYHVALMRNAFKYLIIIN
jgi:hypothetical protein